MLLPDKHISVSGSILGVGALILSHLSDKPIALDLLIRSLEERDDRKGQDIGSLTSEAILALSFLYAIGLIADNDGEVQRCV